MTEPPERTALYRLFNADGELLYVGISSHLKDRWEAHSQSHWGPEVVTRTVEWFEVDSEAAAAEVLAIQTEKPRHNVAHNFDHVPFPCPNWPSLSDAGRQKGAGLADLIRAEINSGNWPEGHRIPSPKPLAAAVGIGEGSAIRAVHALSREGVVYPYISLGYFVSKRRTAGARQRPEPGHP